MTTAPGPARSRAPMAGAPLVGAGVAVVLGDAEPMTPRVLAHSLAGCFFYGIFASKY